MNGLPAFNPIFPKLIDFELEVPESHFVILVDPIITDWITIEEDGEVIIQ